MPWLVFAAALTFSRCPAPFCVAQNETAIQLGDGALLHVPLSLFHRIEFLQKSPSYTVLKGAFEDSPVFFLVIRRNTLPDTFNFQSELKAVLDVTHLDTKPVKGAGSAEPIELLRIVSEGPYQGFLASYKAQYHPSGLVSFYLIGPGHDFYHASPEFWKMVDGYLPGPRPLEKEDIQPWIVVAAILTLILNMVIVWLGIKQFARLKRVH